MSPKLKSIRDPEKVEEKVIEMPQKLDLRNIEAQEKTTTKEGKSEIKKVKISEEAMNLAKNVKISSFPKQVDCEDVMNRVIEGIEQKVTRKIYYVGKGKNQLFCGPVLQVIPIGTYAQITSGQSTYSPKAPIKNKKFKFERTRQLVLRVGKRISNDFVVVIGRNGCVVIESSAYCVLNMPLYIVEPTGDYYYLNCGNRKLELGPGSHLVLYTEKGPIIFATVQKSEKVKDQTIHLKSHTESVKSAVESTKSGTENQPKQQKEEKINSDSEKTKAIESEEKKKIKEKTDHKENKETKVTQIEPILDEKDQHKKSEKSESDNEDIPSMVKQEVQSEPEKPQIKPEPELKPEPEKPEIKPKSEAKLEPETRQESELKSEPEIKPKFETELRSEVKLEPETRHESESELKPEPEVKTDPEKSTVKPPLEAKLEQEKLEVKQEGSQTEIKHSPPAPVAQPEVIPAAQPEAIPPAQVQAQNGHQNTNMFYGILLSLAIIVALVSSAAILYYVGQ